MWKKCHIGRDQTMKIESFRLEMLLKNIVLKPCLLIILFGKLAQFPILAQLMMQNQPVRSSSLFSVDKAYTLWIKPIYILILDNMETSLFFLG